MVKLDVICKENRACGLDRIITTAAPLARIRFMRTSIVSAKRNYTVLLLQYYYRNEVNNIHYGPNPREWTFPFCIDSY